MPVLLLFGFLLSFLAAAVHVALGALVAVGGLALCAAKFCHVNLTALKERLYFALLKTRDYSPTRKKGH